MKVVLYFLVYSSVVLGLFMALMYLMTLVDPDLKNIARKAALMSYHRGHYHLPLDDDDDEEYLKNNTGLSSGLYMDSMDFSELLANITKTVKPD